MSVSISGLAKYVLHGNVALAVLSMKVAGIVLYVQICMLIVLLLVYLLDIYSFFPH